MEGEGTFGIKTGSSLYLQVAQKNTSQECLNGITNYLIALSNNTKYFHTLYTSPRTNACAMPKGQSNKILPLNVTSAINAKTSVVSLVVSSVDALYYYILPLLDESNFYSRKSVDFKL